METNMQTSENAEIITKEEVSLKKGLKVLGFFIFGGLALTAVTNPIPTDEIKNFLLFISASAFIYFFLVNIYFLGGRWRQIFYASLIFLIGFSLFMFFYLSKNPLPH